MMRGFQLKINVKNSSKPIWRRVIVPEEFNFNNLHQVIQILFAFENIHMFDFIIRKKKILVTSDFFETEIGFKKYTTISGFELLKDYLEEGLNLDYCYDYDDEWAFKIRVEKIIDNVKRYPQALKFRGYNLIENCGGIDSFEKMVADGNVMPWLLFNLDEANDLLMSIEVEELLHTSSYVDQFVEVLMRIKEAVQIRRVETFQVVKLIGHETSYWVISGMKKGIVLQMYEDYYDLMDGFYYTDLAIDGIFTHCWTFVLLNGAIDSKYSLDGHGYFHAFKNESGYLPNLIKTDEGLGLLLYLKDLAVALENDHNYVEEDEILEIQVNNEQYVNSVITVHEPIVDFERYNYSYKGGNKITTTEILDDRVCIDIVALPSNTTYFDNRLDIYGIIVCDDNYVIEEIENTAPQTLYNALVDIIIEFSNLYGKPLCIRVSNFNVLFLIYHFLIDNHIDYVRDKIFPDIDSVLIDAFDLAEEFEDYLDDLDVEELLEKLEIFEDEIDESDFDNNQETEDEELLN